MTLKLTSPSPGTIINVAIQIFRSDIKGYFSLSFFATLWSIIPIYGWAKSSTLLATISTKAYQKLRGITENDKDISMRLHKKMWRFWWLNILGSIYVIMAYIVCFSIITAITYVIVNILRGSRGPYSPFFNSFIDSLIVFFLVILFYLAIILVISGLFFWLYGRVCFAELLLANEPNRSAFGSIIRSWHLSQGGGRKIQIIFTIGTAIAGILILGMPSLFLTVITSIFSTFWLVLMIFNGLFQIVKAVIYYDFMCLREGVDLTIEP